MVLVQDGGSLVLLGETEEDDAVLSEAISPATARIATSERTDMRSGVK